MSDVSQIDGSAVRLCREAQGWAINDLAARACLSVKQVRQIEEGGLSSFYSESVKLTAARKIAGLLQLSEAQLFGQAPSVPPQVEEELGDRRHDAEVDVFGVLLREPPIGQRDGEHAKVVAQRQRDPSQLRRRASSSPSAAGAAGARA